MMLEVLLGCFFPKSVEFSWGFHLWVVWTVEVFSIFTTIQGNNALLVGKYMCMTRVREKKQLVQTTDFLSAWVMTGMTCFLSRHPLTDWGIISPCDTSDWQRYIEVTRIFVRWSYHVTCICLQLLAWKPMMLSLQNIWILDSPSTKRWFLQTPKE